MIANNDFLLARLSDILKAQRATALHRQLRHHSCVTSFTTTAAYESSQLLLISIFLNATACKETYCNLANYLKNPEHASIWKLSNLSCFYAVSIPLIEKPFPILSQRKKRRNSTGKIKLITCGFMVKNA
ncbi:hypothetical protein Tsp_09054 [Trichinella spiralis]|uniref:hypothetical protein n=1 Tax=Trichinella spiralis TaxID=6334 RepID=UPI0001EFC786|nr:hypothetical protein Tsp_09054 [Trichinella spiralis]